MRDGYGLIVNVELIVPFYFLTVPPVFTKVKLDVDLHNRGQDLTFLAF